MFAVAFDCPPDPSGAYLLVGVVAAVLVWFVGSLVWGALAPLVGPRLARLVCVEVRVPAAVGRLGLRLRLAVRRLVAAWVAFRCRVSESYFRECCVRRAAAEVHSGLTVYEEWVAESELMSPANKAGFLAEIARYRPSARVVERSRSLAGRSRLIFRSFKYSR